MVENLEVKKGNIIIYPFGYGYAEAKVIKVYGNGLIKVRHNDLWILGFREIIHTSRVLGVAQ